MYEAAIGDLVDGSLRRLERRLDEVVPQTSPAVVDWIRDLSWTAKARDRLITPEMYPMLLLPWWLGGTLDEDRGNELQRDIAYSTVCGYYFIRLIDNLMDGEDTTEMEILPLSALFHGEFQRIYHRYFDDDDTFWSYFDRYWYGSAEMAMLDSRLDYVDRGKFDEIAANKTCAAKIPVTAVALYYGRDDLVGAWCELCDALGRYQQMLDDVSDWQVDQLRNERGTLVLHEGQQRKRADESMLEWFIREGFDWAAGDLGSRMDDLESLSKKLESVELSAYLRERKAMLERWRVEVRQGFDALSSIKSILSTV